MRIYVASSWRNPFQPDVVGTLRIEGHEVYDFRNPQAGGPGGAPERGFSWSEVDPEWQGWDPKTYRSLLQHPVAQTGFRADRAALDWCEACLLVMPCGRSSHLELGYAAGAGKATAVYIPDDVKVEPELMYLLNDQIIVGLAELEEWADDQNEYDYDGSDLAP